MSDEASDPVLVDLVEELGHRLQQGGSSAAERFLTEHPGHAERLRALLPTIRAFADIGEKPAPATIPTVLGDFEIVRQIGEGGMGIVYEAVQRSLGRRVALKVLPRRADMPANSLERFRREAQAAARLHHTNIVAVFGVGEADGVHFYAMQFIRGAGLDTVLSRVRQLRHMPTNDPAEDKTSPLGPRRAQVMTSPPVPDEGASLSSPLLQAASGDPRDHHRVVARIGVQLARGLAHAHGLGILHRDIKPSNLLLDERGTPWIADFGLARWEDGQDLTRSGEVAGTLRYLDPERFRG